MFRNRRIFAVLGLAALAIGACVAMSFAAPHGLFAGGGAEQLIIANLAITPTATLDGLRGLSRRMVESVTDDLDADRIAALEADHKRLTTVMEMVKRDDLSFRVTENMTIAEITDAMMRAQIDREGRAPTFGQSGADLHGDRDTRSDGFTRIEAMGEALYARFTPSHEISAGARPYAGMQISDMARIALDGARQSTIGMSPAELITRALHTTSDFPLAIANTVNRVLQASYATPTSGLKLTAKRTTAPDFRAKMLVKVGTDVTLEKVNEAGEYRRGTFVEGGESYGVETYGKIISISRKLLINDNLGAFQDVPYRVARDVYGFEADFLVNLLQSNPKMSDGKALFHADHRNIAAAGAPLSLESLSDARLAMRRQKDLAGKLVDIVPRFLVVPPTMETVAEQLISPISPTNMGGVNPFAGKLELVVEPRLVDSKAWYLAASPTQIDGLEYAYLEGFEGPYIETKHGFEVDGVHVKVRDDFGAGFVEHRSWFKNPGQP